MENGEGEEVGGAEGGGTAAETGAYDVRVTTAGAETVYGVCGGDEA